MCEWWPGKMYCRCCGEAFFCDKEQHTDSCPHTIEAENALLRKNVSYFDKIGADRLADEVAVLIDRRVLDSRSPVGDALLDYRDNPRSERSDRLVRLEAANAQQAAQIADLTAQLSDCAKAAQTAIELPIFIRKGLADEVRHLTAALEVAKAALGNYAARDTWHSRETSLYCGSNDGWVEAKEALAEIEAVLGGK